MEQNNHKFRLRLNLFDAIILVAVLLVGAAAAWIGLRSGGETAPTAAPTRGKKARVWRMFFSLHSTWGMGMRE